MEGHDLRPRPRYLSFNARLIKESAGKSIPTPTPRRILLRFHTGLILRKYFSIWRNFTKIQTYKNRQESQERESVSKIKQQNLIKGILYFPDSSIFGYCISLSRCNCIAFGVWQCANVPPVHPGFLSCKYPQSCSGSHQGLVDAVLLLG